MRLSTTITALLLGAVAVSATGHNARHSRRHHDLAAREPKPEPEPVEERGLDDLVERGADAKFTFYDVGLGACGKTNVPSDFIVALNTPQYGSGSPGPQCFKWITITYGGKTASAQIMDQCPGCPNRGLDMSRGLFNFFASEDAGVIYGDWWFGGGGSGGGDDDDSTSSSKWTPTSSKWTPTSTSVWTPTSTSSEKKATKTSSSSTEEWTSSSSSSSSTWTSTSTSSTESSTSYDLSTGVASGLAVSTGIGALSPTDVASENVYNMNLAIIEMGAMINAGAAN